MIRKLFQNLREKDGTESLLLARKTDFKIILFYLLVLFLPTQLGKIFFFDFSYVSGIRIDYLAPTIFFTDILFLLILTLFLVDIARSKIIKKFFLNYRHLAVITLLTFFLAINVLLSDNIEISVYGFVRLLEMVILGFLSAYFINKKNFLIILILLSTGVIFESILGIFQFLMQSSVGGIYYFFGERFFSSQTPGIANTSLDGRLILRPYGTFPHPNVMAGFILVSLTMILIYMRKGTKGMIKIFFLATVIIGTLGIFITLSRIAVLLWFLIMAFLILKFIFRKVKERAKSFDRSKVLIRIFTFAIFIAVFVTLFFPLRHRFLDIDLSDKSIRVRKELAESSFLIIKENLFFGVGINNFLVELPYYQKINNYFTELQPVHNIYLFIFVEAGLIGFGLFVFLLYKTFKRIESQKTRNNIHVFNSLKLALIAVLILGVFDHYFITLHQGQLLFSLIIGSSWARY